MGDWWNSARSWSWMVDLLMKAHYLFHRDFHSWYLHWCWELWLRKRNVKTIAVFYDKMNFWKSWKICLSYKIQISILPWHKVNGESPSFETKETYRPTVLRSSKHEMSRYLFSDCLMSESSLPLNHMHKGLSWCSELLPTLISRLKSIIRLIQMIGYKNEIILLTMNGQVVYLIFRTFSQQVHLTQRWYW